MVATSTIAFGNIGFRPDQDLSEEFKNVNISSNTKNPHKGLSVASNSIVNDTRPGGNGDLVKMSGSDDNSYIPYFGPPTRNPLAGNSSTPPRTTPTLADLYAVNSNYIASTIDELVHVHGGYPTTRLLPLVHTEVTDFAWTAYEPISTLTDLTAPLAPPRYVQMKSSKKSASMSRRALGFLIEHEFYSTPEGKFHYDIMINTIVMAVLNTTDILIFRAFFDQVNVYRQSLRLNQKNAPTPEDSLRVLHDWFAIMQKDKDGGTKLVTHVVKFMGMENVIPTDFVLPQGVIQGTMFVDTDTFKGPDGKQNEKIAINGTTSYKGKLIHEMKDIYVDGSTRPINPARRVKTIGGYNIITDFFPSFALDKKYKTSDRSINVFNMDTTLGSFASIGVKEARIYSGRFDGTGELSKMHYDLIEQHSNNAGSFSHLKGAHLDMFITTSDGIGSAQSPLRVAKLWGEILPHYQPHQAIQRVASTIANQLIGSMEETAATKILNEGMEMRAELNKPDLSSPYFQAYHIAVAANNEIDIYTNSLAGNTYGMVKPPRIENLKQGNNLVPGKKMITYERNGIRSPVLRIDLGKYFYSNGINQSITSINNNGENPRVQRDEDCVIVALKDPVDILRRIEIALNAFYTDENFFDASNALITVINNGFNNTNGIEIASFSDTTRFIPYGFGSFPGIRTLARMHEQNESDLGYDKDVLEKSFELERLIKSMYKSVKEIFHTSHVARNPKYVPYWFKVNGTSSDVNDINSMTVFAENFIGSHQTPSYIVIPKRRDDQPRENSFQDVANRSWNSIVNSFSFTAPIQNFSERPILYGSIEEQYTLDNINADDTTASTFVEATKWVSALTKILMYAPNFMVALRGLNFIDGGNEAEFLANFRGLVGEAYYANKTIASRNMGINIPRMPRTGSGLGNFLSDAMTVYVTNTNPSRPDFKRIGALMEFIALHIKNGNVPSVTDYGLHTGMENILKNMQTDFITVEDGSSVYDTPHMDAMQLGLDDDILSYVKVVNTRLCIDRESYGNFLVNPKDSERNHLSGVHIRPAAEGSVAMNSEDPVQVLSYFNFAHSKIKRIHGSDTSGFKKGFLDHLRFSKPGVSARQQQQQKRSAADHHDYVQPPKRMRMTEYAGNIGSIQYNPNFMVGTDAPMNVMYDDEHYYQQQVQAARGEISMEDIGIEFNHALANNYTLCANNRDFLKRTSELLFLFSPINEYQFELWETNNVFIPVDFLLERPYRRYMMVSGLAVQGGPGTGFTAYSKENFEVGDDAKVKVTIGHYSYYSGTVIVNPKNYMILDDIKADAYMSGEGIEFYSPKDWDPANVNTSLVPRGNTVNFQKKKSFFSFMCPYGSCRHEPVLNEQGYIPGLLKDVHSITGSWTHAAFDGVCHNFDAKSMVVPHYASAPFYMIVYAFDQLNLSNPVSPLLNNYYYSISGDYNEIVWMNHQEVFNPKTGERDKRILNADGFGPNGVYDKCKSFRVGEIASQVVHMEYEKNPDKVIIMT